MKKCPYCAEDIQDAALVCKHCGRDLAGGASQVQIVAPPKKTSPAAWGCLGVLLLFVLVIIAGQCNSQPTARPQSSAPKSHPQTAASTPPTEPAPTSRWGRSDTESKIDDSKGVVFAVVADEEIEGWLKRSKPTLIIRCVEGKTEAYVNVGMQSSVEYGSLDQHTITLRFDDAPAVKQRWSESTDNEALFSPSSVQLARSVAKAKRLRFQFTPFNANPQLVEFNVEGFEPHRAELAKTCKWKQ